MHETSLMADLLRKIESVARLEGSKRVVGVKVGLGALSHISEGHFREHFDIGTVGTAAEGARLEVVVGTDPNDPGAQDIRILSVEIEEP